MMIPVVPVLGGHTGLWVAHTGAVRFPTLPVAVFLSLLTGCHGAGGSSGTSDAADTKPTIDYSCDRTGAPVTE